MKPDAKYALFVGSTEVGHQVIHSLCASSAADWRVAIVHEPSEALGVLERGAWFDVVIANEQPTFLETVGRARPDVARLWYGVRASPDVDACSRLGALTPGTTDPDLLESLVGRSVALQSVLSDPRARELVGDLEKLPALPKTYWSLVHATSDARTNAAKLGTIVESDPAMAAHVLRLVNSAVFGVRRRVTSVAQAVSLLGIELLKGLVLSSHVTSAFGTTGAFSSDALQRDSLRVARIAQKLAPEKSMADDAFTSGILQDIGKLALATKHPKDYAEVVRRARATGDPERVVERQVFGVGHEEVGAMLLATWGIPLSIVECVAWHHRPSAAEWADAQLLALVHASCAMTAIVTAGAPEDSLDVEFLRRVGLADELPRWRAVVETAAAEWAEG